MHPLTKSDVPPISIPLLQFDMSFTLPNSLFRRIPHPRWPMLFYAATWTTVLTATVAVASFSPEIAFVSAIGPTSASSRAACPGANSIRLPLDVPSESFCFPSRLFRRSRIDVVVPPVFAAVIVAGSAFVVKAMGLWEAEDELL